MRRRWEKIPYWVVSFAVFVAFIILIILFCRVAFGAGGERELVTAVLPPPPTGGPPRAARVPIIVEAILGGTVLALGVVLIGAMVKKAGDE